MFLSLDMDPSLGKTKYMFPLYSTQYEYYDYEVSKTY